MKIALYAIAGAGVLILLLLATWWLASWNKDREYKNRPAEELAPKEVLRLPGPAGRFNPVTGRAPVVRRGLAPAPEEDVIKLEAFAVAREAFATDSVAADTLPALYPPVRVSRDGDIGMLAVMNSRNEWDRQESKCPEGRRWEAGTADSTMFFNCERALPGFFPRVGKAVLKCTVVAAAGYGIGLLADVEEPLLPAGVAGGGCALLELTH